MASGRRPPRSRGRGLDVGRSVLAGQDEDPAQAGPLARPGRRSARRRRPSRCRAAPRPPARDLAPQVRRRALAKKAGDGLPTIRARDPGRELEAGDERARSRASGPRASATTDCGACRRASAPAADEPERAVEVVVGRLLRRIADDDGRGRRARRRPASSWLSRRWPVELGPRVGGGEDVERLPGKARGRPGRGRRQRGLEALRPGSAPRRFAASAASVARLTAEVFVTIRNGIPVGARGPRPPPARPGPACRRRR